jgi:hypothetical protein
MNLREGVFLPHCRPTGGSVKTTVGWMVAAAIIVACWINCSAAEEQGGNDRRQQAQALVASGKPADALPIYDELTAGGSSDPSLYTEASRAATAAQDMRRAATYIERHVKAEPDNFVLPSIVAYAWRLAGDEAKAQQAAKDYIAYWKASTNPVLRAHPYFRIDQFTAGNATVEVQQCVEIAGRLGVGYVFDVFAPENTPQSSGGSPAPIFRQRIVLEHDRAVQELLAKQLNKPDVVRPSLDLLTSNSHATLNWFDSEPDYATLRAIVVKLLAGADVSSNPPMGKAWAGLTCVTEGK